MQNNINIEVKIKNQNFTSDGFDTQEYENTHFLSCDFNQMKTSDIDFIDCVFEDCNLSLIVVNNTGFKNIQFINCKITGVDFSVCNSFLFQVSFSGCNLKLVNFEKTKLTETLFENCDLSEALFSETNLEKAIFENCNLNQADFNFTNLKHADFSSAYGYVINPYENKIQKAKFSLNGLPGLLMNYDIEVV